MKFGDLILRVNLNEGLNEIKLDGIYPIQKLENKDVLSYELFIQEDKVANNYGNKLVVNAKKATTLDIVLDDGYYATFDKEWTNKFLNNDGWSGGDGIFTFNLDTGYDQFDLKEDVSTMFIFSDTFVGYSSLETLNRIDPTLMINNSMAYMKNGQINFHYNENENGNVTSYFFVADSEDREGTIARNLISTVPTEYQYLSGKNPKNLTLEFDIYKNRFVTHLRLFNYFDKNDFIVSKRGFKNIKVYTSVDNKSFELVSETTLNKATTLEDFDEIVINKNLRYIKVLVESNYNDESFNEGKFGLRKFEVYNKEHKYLHIKASASNELQNDKANNWIWLQDGVVIGSNLYFIPLLVNQDLTQPEGLQFKIKEAAMYKVPIKDGKLIVEEQKQLYTPLLVTKDKTDYLFGNAIMSHTKQSGVDSPDGYIYVYGYKSFYGLRELLVARVKEENFEYFDDWQYFDGKEFQHDILKSAPILPHISCEMSVSKIMSGVNKGKYIAVYSYDTNNPYVAFSIGDSPVGPFSPPQKIFYTPEPEVIGVTTYTYNAKAHPHLSNSDDILASYNTNTYSFDHNMSNYEVYRPRFIRIKKVK